MPRMSKNVKEYLDAHGWSSELFLPHAKLAFQTLKAQFKIGRTVIHIITETKLIKAYVHHNGRSREWATITDSKSKELFSAHYTTSPTDFVDALKNCLKVDVK